MSIMGLTDLPYWLAWFLYYLIVITLICFGLTILLIPVFPFSNKVVVYLFFWSFGMSLFGFAVLISAFFTNGLTAAIFGSITNFALSWIVLFVQDKKASTALKILLGTIPQVSI